MSHLDPPPSGLRIVVHPRIAARHPDITEADVRSAFGNTIARRLRVDTSPPNWVGVGMDDRGRLLEYVAVQSGRSTITVFHAMKATAKVMMEVGLR